MKLKKRERKEAAVSIQKVLSLRALLNIFLRKCNKQARIAKKREKKKSLSEKKLLRVHILTLHFYALFRLYRYRNLLFSLSPVFTVCRFSGTLHISSLQISLLKSSTSKMRKSFKCSLIILQSRKKNLQIIFSLLSSFNC